MTMLKNIKLPSWVSTSSLVVTVCVMAVLGLLITYQTQPESATHKAATAAVLAATWNMAAINNNPFEYWITYDENDNYNAIMQSFSDIMVNRPADVDVSVNEVFTQEMFDVLYDHMGAIGWENLNEVRKYWDDELKNRKIVSTFLADGMLGKKRLISMPDRTTNTINAISDEVLTRPTVINCYQGADLTDEATWWAEWLKFMFDTDVSIEIAAKDGTKEIKTHKIHKMITPIKKSKYPSITTEEEAMSIPLQTVTLAIFDAVLIHLMNHVSKTQWPIVREEICTNLNRRKNLRSIDILLDPLYNDNHVVFLQEVSRAFIQQASEHPKSSISFFFDVLAPTNMDTDRDQNSVILLKKGVYKDVLDVTDKFMKWANRPDIVANLASKADEQASYEAACLALPITANALRTDKGRMLGNAVQETARHLESSKSSLPLAPGDLILIDATNIETGRKYIFASFHGDTNGLATVPVLTAVQRFVSYCNMDHHLLFGMDANTYEHPESDQQGVTAFAEYYTSAAMHLNSCYGRKPNPKNYTTFHARTYLQTQLNKAVSLAEKGVKGDKNPKDFILFFDKDFNVLWTHKDNTGSGKYINDMIFPTISFPSDHAITSTFLLAR